MDTIWNFIKDNQIFSGLLAGLVGLFGVWYSVKKSPGNQKLKVGNNSKGYQAGGDIKINEK